MRRILELARSTMVSEAAKDLVLITGEYPSICQTSTYSLDDLALSDARPRSARKYSQVFLLEPPRKTVSD